MNIKEIRSKTKMTQKQFSEYFDIPIRTLQDWEQDKRHPPKYILKMIVKILELDSLI